MDHVAVAVLVADAGDHPIVTAVNRAAADLVGVPRDRLVGTPLARALRLERQGAPFDIAAPGALAKLAQRDGGALGYQLIAADQRSIEVRLTVVELGPEPGGRWACLLDDVSALQELEAQRENEDRIDTATGVLSRMEFIRRVDEQHRVNAAGKALAAVSIDRWDALRHAFGEEFCAALARHVARAILGASDAVVTVGRFEPETFAVALDDASEQTLAAFVESTNEQVRDLAAALAQPSLTTACSIGVVAGSAARTIDQWRVAKQLVVEAREVGGDRGVVAWEGDDRGAPLRNAFDEARQVVDAIARGSFELYAQPIHSARDPKREASHREVLLRMRGPSGELVAPNRFVPTAERAGLISALDLWVLERIVGFLGARPAQGQRLAVNASAISLADPRFRARVLALIAATPEAAGRLCLEITETEMLTAAGEVRSLLERLRVAGVQVAIDDFGSGSASFRYLTEIPADFVKLDGGLTRGCASSAQTRACVSAIVATCHALGMRVIAEFIEDQRSLETMRDLGVDLVQGYYLGKPAPLEPRS